MDKRIIHSVFEETVERFPERTAVEHHARAVTYHQLNRDADRVSQALAALGMVRGEIAGIFMEEGISYIESLLGTLKTGGIFMPLNTRFPRRRLEYLLTKTLPRVLITRSHLKEELTRLIADANLFDRVSCLLVVGEEENPTPFRFQNGEWVPEPKQWPEQSLPFVSDPGDTNYILFTSGSTGEPKAIAGSQKGLSHFIHWEIGEFGLDEKVRVSLLAPTTFDVSLRDIFVPLIAGGTLCIPDQETRMNASHLLEWMEDSKLTLIHCVPSLFRMVMREIEYRGNERKALPDLKYVLLAGEALYGSDVIKWRQIVGDHAELINLYGPTETTLAKAFHRIKGQDLPLNAIVPIGKPIPNAALLIIKDKRLCAIGEIGDIYIKTPFRSNGYYNDPELNSQYFNQNPLHNDTEDIVYKTGDLGRYLPDRSVEFIGRQDRQVKINGIRIELAEIEKVLISHKAIRQVLVISYKKSNREDSLVCYTTENEKIETADLIEHLKIYLPDYMIPSFFVTLKEFPLNINGKIDRKALPKPEELMYERINYEPLANRTEEELARIWEETLGLKRIGANNPYMEIGGNSLNAIKIISRIYKTFEVEISIKEFFDHPTIRKLSQLINRSKKFAYHDIQPIEEQEYYDLSHAQRRLWVLDQMEKALTAYNNLEALLIEGDFDVPAFRKAFEAMIERHESLRTTFVTIEGEPKQRIHKEMGFAMEEIDLSDRTDQEDWVARHVKEEANLPFDLGKGPLLRAKLLRLNERKYIFLFNMHHIICDGWSMGVMVKELAGLYNSYVSGRETILPPLRIQYKDYAAWQNALLGSDRVEEHRQYWLGKLSGDIPSLDLPTDYPRPSISTFNGKTVRRSWEKALTDGLKKLGREKNTSLFMILLAIVKVLLYRYTSQKDIIVGSPVAARNHPDLEDQVGFYVNTLALRDTLEVQDSFLTVLSRVKKTMTEAYDHQWYPFDKLVGELNLKRDMNRGPLFDVMLVLEERVQGELDLEKAKVTELEIDSEKSRYDLTFYFEESDKGIRLDLNYNTDLFKEDRIRRLAANLEELTKSLLEKPTLSIQDLNILTESEKKRLLIDFNNTKTVYPFNKTIVDLFEEQVERNPYNTAVIFEGTELTYRELNEQTNQLAHYLRERYSLQPDERVGIMVDRSEWLIIGLLGILKAGGAYLPIEMAYPDARVDYILEDSGCNVLLIEGGDQREEGRRKYKEQGLINRGQNRKIDIVDIHTAKKDVKSNPPHITSGCHLAYVIYTSGSSGNPKGVMIEHHSLINMALDQIKFLGITESDRVAQVASPSFDVSMFEISVALFSGATIVIVSRDTISNPGSFVKYLDEKGVTVIALTPPHLNTLDGAELKTVKTIITGGEPPVMSDVLYYSRNKQYINTYGPTEVSVNASCHKMDPDFSYQSSIPIGKPISNTSVYILNESLKLLPIGVVGEICVSGAGLARGYLNHPELTQKQFIENPFHKGERLYRTGDLGRWLSDGNIEFIGRKDEQVKVRGYRIELGEIEQHLLQHPTVKAAAVITKPLKGTKELVAYFVGDGEVNISELRHHLEGRLPDYMVPGYFVPMEKLPLTPNGKIDKSALPEPERQWSDLRKEYKEPRSELETQLAMIWQDVLGMERIGIHDNFFESGGHSLKAIRLISKIHKELGIEVSLREVFSSPTVAELAAIAAQKESSAFMNITPAVEQGLYDLSHAQRRLWAIDHMEKDLIAYNIHGAYLLKGDVNGGALSLAFKRLIERHESLRTVFIMSDGQPKQRIHHDTDFVLEEIDISKETRREALAKKYSKEEATTPFDLERGPLLRVKLLKLERGRYLLLFTMHHIIGDGWSIGVLERELVGFYNAYALGEEKALPPLRIQYKDFAAWQNFLLESESAEKHRRYWHRKLSGELPVLSLPTDYSRPSVQTFNGRTMSFGLDETLKDDLTNLGKQCGASLFMVLVAALKALLFRYTGQTDIILGSPVAGRENPELEDQIGFYVNTLALRDEVKGEESFLSLLKKVRETTIEAYEHQIYPFDSLVNELKLERDLSRSPFFDVMVLLQTNDPFVPEMVNIKVTEFVQEQTTSKFDMIFQFVNNGHELMAHIEYNTDLFKEDTIRRLSSHFKELVRSLLEDGNRQIRDLNLLPESERKCLLEDFNDTWTDYPREKSIVDLFEEQVERAPDNTAVVFKERKLTYKELNELANRVAHHLRDHYGIRPDERVGIMVDRSEQMIIGLMGILKAGGAYVPIDLDYPPERIAFVLKDSECRVLIAEKRTNPNLKQPGSGINIQNLSIVDMTTIENEKEFNPPHTVLSHHLAYVMYTSGSTGKPKGVLVEHKSVVNLVRNTNYTAIKPSDHISQLSNYAFDGSTFDIFGALLNGASLWMISKDLLLSFDELCRFITENRINITFIPTAFGNKLIDVSPHVLNMFDKIYFGGEEASLRHMRTGLKYRKNRDSIVNAYGPTEATTFSAYYVVDTLDGRERTIPIGAPISNATLYVLDESFHLQPIGVRGEIFIGGDGVARGYLNNPELTSEKFIDNPFVQGERLFRTGDIGRWLPDGHIECLGRKDGQVKIRGYRVELGEIENHLMKHPAIQEVSVVAGNTADGNKELIAYFVNKDGSDVKLDVSGLRGFLNQFLPDYMLPAYFVQLDSLPLTPNGKVDRKALPSPHAYTLTQGTPFVAPRNKIEEQLLRVWERVLGRKDFGIHDNYFALGGDSIKAIQAVARLNQEGLKLEVRHIFQYPTIAELAPRVEVSRHAVDQSVVSGLVPLTAIQAWFFEACRTDRHHFNQSLLLASAERFNENALRAVFQKIQDHHDALRMRCWIEGDRVIQENVGLNYPLSYQTVNLTEEKDGISKLRLHAEEVQRSLRLESGPLMKVVLYRLKDGDRLFIVIHHFVVDGVSWRILLEDIVSGYEQCMAGKEIRFPLKTDSFKSWADKIQPYSRSEALLKEKNYWKTIESTRIEPLPMDNKPLESGGSRFGDKGSRSFTLTETATEALLTKANQAFNTEVNDLLLTALARAMKRWHGGRRTLLTLEGHGREEVLEGMDISRTVGWFTSLYPVIIDLPEGEDAGRQIKKIKETLRKVPNRGVGYGVLRYLTPLELKKEMGFNLKPRMAFNYLGQFDSESKTGLFRVTEEPVGLSISPEAEAAHDLDMSAIVTDGQLRVTLHYDRTCYRKETAENILVAYKEEIEGIIAHCLGRESSEGVVSNIDYDGLLGEDLDRILVNLPDQ
jgi:amino acid adenylation domain-containing protein/non-ribosomal peptide synthase protein (TIGR01720 family)